MPCIFFLVRLCHLLPQRHSFVLIDFGVRKLQFSLTLNVRLDEVKGRSTCSKTSNKLIFFSIPKKTQKKQPLTTKKIEPFGTLHEKKQCTPGASCYFNLLFKLSLCTENIHQLFFQGLFFTCPECLSYHRVGV